MGGLGNFQSRRVFLDCKRSETFRETRAADVGATAAQQPVRVPRTSANAELVADFYGRARAHPAAQAAQQRIRARSSRRLASPSRGYRRRHAEAVAAWL